MDRFSRRAFFKFFLIGVSGLSGLRIFSAENKQKKPEKPRPPQTCGGYIDRNGDGVCERSEQAQKTCDVVKCPGHKKNVLRKTAKKNGAPEGTCAIWADPKEQGFCDKAQDPCIYTTCPAHKNTTNAI
jgi:hypothetical protein